MWARLLERCSRDLDVGANDGGRAHVCPAALTRELLGTLLGPFPQTFVALLDIEALGGGAVRG
jgi:hypothetical protein